MIPPRHFGCRATLVRVVSGGDASENTPDLKKVAEKDDFQNATKKELIASGKISENETKKAALARIRNDEFVLPEKPKSHLKLLYAAQIQITQAEKNTRQTASVVCQPTKCAGVAMMWRLWGISTKILVTW